MGDTGWEGHKEGPWGHSGECERIAGDVKRGLGVGVAAQGVAGVMVT